MSFRTTPISEEAMNAARGLAKFSDDARWRDLGNGTLEVVTTQNGPVQRYLVLPDGTTRHLASAPRSLAGKWSLGIGCVGGCLVWIVAAVAIAEGGWIALAFPLGLALVVAGELLARRSRGDVARYLEREGGDEGWNRFEPHRPSRSPK
jgi:hypothetical protein